MIILMKKISKLCKHQYASQINHLYKEDSYNESELCDAK